MLSRLHHQALTIMMSGWTMASTAQAPHSLFQVRHYWRSIAPLHPYGHMQNVSDDSPGLKHLCNAIRYVMIACDVLPTRAACAPATKPHADGLTLQASWRRTTTSRCRWCTAARQAARCWRSSCGSWCSPACQRPVATAQRCYICKVQICRMQGMSRLVLEESWLRCKAGKHRMHMAAGWFSAVSMGHENIRRCWTGGPGHEGPRPAEASAWIKAAVNHFRVLLMDQRGTGLSAAITPASLVRRGTPQQQAEYLAHFRSDTGAIGSHERPLPSPRWVLMQ